jgi:hypothetical protein
MSTVNASGLYDQLRDARDALERLHVTGRLSMSSDILNARWVDVDDAVRAAHAGLDVAIDALAWMDTRPDRA